jgi:hypothetical protein
MGANLLRLFLRLGKAHDAPAEMNAPPLCRTD